MRKMNKHKGSLYITLYADNVWVERINSPTKTKRITSQHSSVIQILGNINDIYPSMCLFRGMEEVAEYNSRGLKMGKCKLKMNSKTRSFEIESLEMSAEEIFRFLLLRLS